MFHPDKHGSSNIGHGNKTHQDNPISTIIYYLFMGKYLFNSNKVHIWKLKTKKNYMPFYFKQDILVFFLHNSYGTLEFPDCGNLEGADCMENLRWANTDPLVHFRKTNTGPSVHFRKANTDPSMHLRNANTEFLLPVLLPISLLSLLQV